MKTPLIPTILAIVQKDLRAELRSRELVSTMALFALLSILVFSFSLELNRTVREEAVAGILWVTVIFASVLGLNRSMAMERDQGNLDAMLLAPIERQAIFFGKLVGNFIFTGVVAFLLVPLMTILFNRPLFQLSLLAVLLLGTLGFSTVGTLLATMTVQTRARESLLPIVMMPVALPVLLPSVFACIGILNNSSQAEWTSWLQMLAVVDLVLIVLCFLLFEYVIEE